MLLYFPSHVRPSDNTVLHLRGSGRMMLLRLTKPPEKLPEVTRTNIWNLSITTSHRSPMTARVIEMLS